MEDSAEGSDTCCILLTSVVSGQSREGSQILGLISPTTLNTPQELRPTPKHLGQKGGVMG